MKIRIKIILFLFAVIFYGLMIYFFCQDFFPFSDAYSLYEYASNNNFNTKTLLRLLPYTSENLYIIFLGIFTSPFTNQFNFILLTSIITSLFALNTSRKIYEYEGISKNNSLIISIFSIFLFLLLPLGKLALINTQSSFIALMLAFGTNTLFKPSIFYLGFHWVYIPATAFVIFIKKFIQIISTLKLKYNQLLIGIFIIFFGTFILNYIGKLDELLIAKNSSFQQEVSILITIVLIILNISFYQLSKKQLYLNLIFIAISAFLISFVSSKTSNRLCITLIFYDYCFITSTLLKTIFKKEGKLNKTI
jgi:hypothetical protein